MKLKTEEAKKIFAYKANDDGTISIYGYKGNEECIEIPSEIGNKKVTCIGDGPYRTRFNFRLVFKVIVPDTVNKIGLRAFQNCRCLRKVVMPDSIVSIEAFAFEGCDNLKSIYIPKTVKNIEEYSFFYCKALENIYIPDNVVSIGNYAFNNCESLKKISLPYNTTIGMYNFNYGQIEFR